MTSVSLLDSPAPTPPLVSAVILDLDGTLLNTEQATRDLLKEFLGRYERKVDMEKEHKRLGMMHKDAAMAIVKDYDLPITSDQYSAEILPMYYQKWLHAPALPGADRLIKHLHKHGIPFALASNSVRKNIEMKISPHQGWRECFSVILGSDEVKSGKPAPDIFLEAAKQMNVDPAFCLVIEDSIIGVRAGKAAKMKVVAVPSVQSEYDHDQYLIADHVLNLLLDFRPEQWGLPPFEDAADNTLQIEPIRFKALFTNGTLKETGNGASDLPVQLVGIYFGWTKDDTHRITKIVISIHWDRCCCAVTRCIQACFIDGSGEGLYDHPMEIMLVGYIRGFSSKATPSPENQILDGDKFIADAALDLPAFAYIPIRPTF